MKLLRTALCALGLLCASSTAHATGIPECNGLTIDSLGSCELRVDADCRASCSIDVTYHSCSTIRATECRDVCTEVPGEGECDVQEVCEEQCSTRDFTCASNCASECGDDCQYSCNDADDVQQCLTGCQASCNLECDNRCPRVPVGGSCVDHCVECMGATCKAWANMDCQLECQDVEYEQCQRDIEGGCEASCNGSGAIFCDGQIIAFGDQLTECAQALVERGASFELEVEAEVELDLFGGDSEAGLGCAVGPNGSGDPLDFLAPLGLALGLGLTRRRRRR